MIPDSAPRAHAKTFGDKLVVHRIKNRKRQKSQFSGISLFIYLTTATQSAPLHLYFTNRNMASSAYFKGKGPSPGPNCN